MMTTNHEKTAAELVGEVGRAHASGDQARFDEALTALRRKLNADAPDLALALAQDYIAAAGVRRDLIKVVGEFGIAAEVAEVLIDRATKYTAEGYADLLSVDQLAELVAWAQSRPEWQDEFRDRMGAIGAQAMTRAALELGYR